MEGSGARGNTRVPVGVQKALVGVLLCGLVLAVACSRLRLREAFEPTGDVMEITPTAGAEQPAELDEDRPVRLFWQSAPDGFDMIARDVVVQAGYDHRVIGRVDLTLGEGACDPGQAHYLSREAVLHQLRDRARKEGGNAVIYIDTRAEDVWMSDCDRLDQVGPEAARGEPWGTGWVVWLEAGRRRTPQDAGVAAGLAAPADRGGVAALPADAGLPPAPPPADAGLGDAAVPR